MVFRDGDMGKTSDGCIRSCRTLRCSTTSTPADNSSLNDIIRLAAFKRAVSDALGSDLSKVRPRPVPRELVDVVELVIDQIAAERALSLSGKVYHVNIGDGPSGLSSCLRASGIRARIGTSPAGEGANAQVYRAGDRAVKVVRLTACNNLSVGLMQWKAEAKHAAMAGQLGVGPVVHDAFVCDDGGDDGPVGVIVSDFVRGRTLGAWRLRASAADRSEVDAELASKIQRLHRAGIIHNDLHLGNILVMPRATTAGGTSDRVRIVDYGMSSTVQEIKDADYHSLSLNEASGSRSRQRMQARLVAHVVFNQD